MQSRRRRLTTYGSPADAMTTMKFRVLSRLRLSASFGKGAFNQHEGDQWLTHFPVRARIRWPLRAAQPAATVTRQ